MRQIISAWICILGLLSFSALAMGEKVPATPNKQILLEQLAQFFQRPVKEISIECKGHSFSIEKEGNADYLHVCVHRAMHQKRCEITLHALKPFPAHNLISYDVRIGGDWQVRPWWFAVTQIHSFPDKGEAWRCPVASLEVKQGFFRFPNRWDSNLISRTTGYNCTEPGSTIQQRMLFSSVPVRPDDWHHVSLDAQLSGTEPGEIKAAMDGNQLADSKGLNAYNDKRGTFLKFGIYIPNGWGKAEKSLCADYRHVRLENKE